MPGSAVVADDQELSRIAFSAILSKHLGFDRVAEAATLDEALDHLAFDRSIELALIDLVMPGMVNATGFAAVREGFPDVKLVAISGSSLREDILLALRSGVHGYIIKDASVSEMTRALRMVMEGVIYVPPLLAQPELRLPDAAPPSLEADDDPPIALTPRQRDVLRLITDGRSNKEIARTLDLGEGTVKIHTAALFRVLNVSNRSAAAVVGARLLR